MQGVIPCFALADSAGFYYLLFDKLETDAVRRVLVKQRQASCYHRLEERKQLVLITCRDRIAVLLGLCNGAGRRPNTIKLAGPGAHGSA
jgi:hypothetical protein